MKEHRGFYEFCRAVAATVFPLLEKLEVRGLENVPARGPVIMVANHIAFMDIPNIGLRVKRHEHHMGKSELFAVPVLGTIMRWLDAFPVRRGESDRESLRTADELLSAGQVLVVFPEGHRSGTGKMAAGLPGVALIAMRSGAPIVPVGISGTEHIFKGRYGPWAPRVVLTYGAPFTLTFSGGRKRDDLERGIDTIMRRIAALVPPEYRGIYAAALAVAPTPAPVAAVEGAQPGAAGDGGQNADAVTQDASAPPAAG
jgi:1-acyl-sn-glycerol-3-phosphate acyltransferase